MQWSASYELGIPTIDSQHKRLFELFQELESAISQDVEQVDIKRLLTTLDQYKARHFQLEEKYMKESAYPGLQEQQAAHAVFSNLFGAMITRLDEEGYSPGLATEMKAELAKWIEDHVTGLDKAFGEYYRQKTANG